MTISFVSSAVAGDELTMAAKVLKIEGDIAFSQGEIWNAGKLVAHGTHTLGFVSTRK
eukprot:CAMPEP_0202946962 /NCGR_PEP_ID=MMETSP1395-20130829/10435_1 /ASSEMBLY_ACC=CAM_ASM_000871 /TAXON_ID=5961 /ORGANISM="Blepharisma japonicum, Strain Stock R1072" /LENGTH=56 /DNA_ID=CAMNT_0049647879 /DNA_START=270 /DNA_END=437 /DNA_ORIENTATION=+